MTHTLRDLVSARIEDLGVTKAEYARRVGITPSYLSQILTSKIVLPSDLVRRRLAEDLGSRCSIFWYWPGNLPRQSLPWTRMMRMG